MNDLTETDGKTYISNNHSTGILDTNSYSRFMNALGENSGYS
jgi:hypothetical protein